MDIELETPRKKIISTTHRKNRTKRAIFNPFTKFEPKLI